MPFQKGHEKLGGRPKGKQNKCTLEVKDLTMRAFKKTGGEKKFFKWAADNYDMFVDKFLAKMLPKPIELSGPDGEDIAVTHALDRIAGGLDKPKEKK